MTIDQAEVIIAAFEREIAKHKAVLAKQRKAWKLGDLYARVFMGKAEDRIAIWKKAAAIVRRVAGEVKK